MGATMETLDVVEQVPASPYGRARQGRSPLPSVTEEIARRPAARRRKEERWSSSLSARDLRCLLAALEESVLPALIAGYAPARAAPIDFGDARS